jgi:ABC-type multidrug transport system ATPase subunit
MSELLAEATLRERRGAEPGILRSHADAWQNAALANDYAAASTALHGLHGLRGQFPGYGLLREIAQGRMPFVRFGPVVLAGESPKAVGLVQDFQAAVDTCAGWLGLPAPIIVLQRLADQRYLHYTLPCLPGLAIIRLSGQIQGRTDGLRAIVFHEVAHCFLNCGVRLLDEGLAHYFAGHFAGIELTIAPERLPSIRSVLTRRSDAMFGELGHGISDAYQAACVVGAQLVEAVLAKVGVPGLLRLFGAAAEASSDAELVALVESVLGEPLPRSQPSAVLDENQAALVNQVRQAIFEAWRTKVASDLDGAIAALDAADFMSSQGLLDSMISASINRALLAVNAGEPLQEQELARIDAMMREGACLPMGRQQLWRGCRAVLTIAMVRPNPIKVATAGQQAVQAFKQAAELIPDDPDLLVHHATLLINAPEQYGGDRDLGVSKLRQAMALPEYRNHAARILEKYGVVVEASIEEPSPSAAGAAQKPVRSFAHAPVLLATRSLELALGNTFRLQPGDFTLHAGERVGIVGRNGSGKTMLLETLLGLRNPTAGQVELTLPGHGDIRHRLGGLLQGADLPADIKVQEIMRMHEVMYAVTDGQAAQALGMQELRHRPWKQLSRGQKQRVLLWLAFAHRPALALLDEPSLGLDEWHGRALRQLLESSDAGIVLISHHAADLAAMDRVLCMDGGRVYDQGTMAELVERHVGRFKATLRQTIGDEARTALAGLPGLRGEPLVADNRWTLYGGDGFDAAFRDFIERFRLSAFSLEATGVEDFLAEVSRA